MDPVLKNPYQVRQLSKYDLKHDRCFNTVRDILNSAHELFGTDIHTVDECAGKVQLSILKGDGFLHIVLVEAQIPSFYQDGRFTGQGRVLGKYLNTGMHLMNVEHIHDAYLLDVTRWLE